MIINREITTTFNNARQVVILIQNIILVDGILYYHYWRNIHIIIELLVFDVLKSH